MLAEGIRYNCFPLQFKYEEYQERGYSLQGLIIDKYRVKKRIDYGSECEVYLAINMQTDQKLAVKLIDIRSIKSQANQKVKEIRLKCIQNQIQIMTSLNNPYLLKCFQVYENEDFKLLVVQYCNGVTLQNYIEDKQKIPQIQAWTILSHIIYGLTTLHDNFIVLRDLKADNIISNNRFFKIANFHYAERLPIKDSKQQVKGPCMGSLKLMAPQVLLRKPYGLKIDTWSLGVMFFQMLYGDYPYSSQLITDFYQEIIKKDYFSKQQAPQMFNYKASCLSFSFLKLALSTESQKRADIKKIYEFLFTNDLLYQNQSQDQSSFLQNNKLQSLKFQLDQQTEDYGLLLQQIIEECSKIKCIIIKIIYPIQKYKKQFEDNREIIEFLFLVSVRCLNSINQIENKIKQNKNYLKNLHLFNSTAELVDKLTQTIHKKFNEYSDKLTKVQDNIGSMLKDWFSKKLSSEKFKNKQRFFVGIQGLQYTKDEQINYTVRYFNKYVLKQLQKYKSLQSVIQNMKNYAQNTKSILNQPNSSVKKSFIYAHTN